MGSTRRWGYRSAQLREAGWQRTTPAGPKVRFADLAAMFMLPVMRFYDRKSHGVDFVNRDFIVLARLLYMLGVCMEGIALQPEAPVLGTHLLDLLRSRYFVFDSSVIYVSRSHPDRLTGVTGEKG